MRSLPDLPTRLTRTFAVLLLLAGAAGPVAALCALVLVGPRVSGLWVSAELAVGAASGLALLLGRGPRARVWPATGVGGAAGALPATFELRSPKRALAEAGKGMLRFAE